MPNDLVHRFTRTGNRSTTQLMIDDPFIGYRLGNFRLERLLGRGGMAQVYYGWDEGLHRPVAIKIIDARFRSDPTYAARFVQEARAIATWRHENILQVYYADQHEGLYYFVMEYIDGPDLAQIMRQYADDGELMPHEDVLWIGRAIADALDYAHAKQVIHRDVKPSNVMVAKDRRVVLADFGLAMDVQQGSIGSAFGTPHYIAPEQARHSADAVPKSDLYALGVILYEMLTGVVPFDDPSPASLALQHITQPPPPPRSRNPALNQATEAVLLQALSKQPADRYPTGRALMDALAAALAEDEPATAHFSLPPLPVGMDTPRPLSEVSVVERVSLFVPPPPAAYTPPLVSARTVPDAIKTPAPITPLESEPVPVAVPAAQPSLGWNHPLIWVAAAGGALSLLVLLAVLFLFLRGDDGAATNRNATMPSTTSTAALIANEPATNNMLPTETDTPTTQPADTATLPPDTPEPTQPDATDAPTLEPATAAPTLPPADPAAPAPTIAFPGGRRIELLYDAYSFYLYNPNSDRLRASSIAFEALDIGGQPTRYRFEGQQWAQFYSFIEEGRCDRIETTRASSLLRPAQCRRYNATVTPQLADDFVFWTARPDVSQFRVLWDGVEVGRCELTVNRCEVYLP